jgi:hypothetical protein
MALWLQVLVGDISSIDKVAAEQRHRPWLDVAFPGTCARVHAEQTAAGLHAVA